MNKPTTDESIGEYQKTNIPTKPVEVEVSHVEKENLFFAARTGGEVVSLTFIILFIYLTSLSVLEHGM